MSLRKISRLGIGPKLVLWSTLILSFSLIFVSTTVYYLLSTSLRKSDQELIMKLANSYAHTFKLGGASFLKKEISPEVIVSIVNDEGKEHFELLPAYLDRDFEDEEEIEQIRIATKELPRKEGWNTILLLSGDENKDLFHKLEYRLRKIVWKNNWSSILPLIDNDMAEVYTMSIGDGLWIRVGRSSEEREEHLAKIRNISLFVILPFIFIGFLMSLILSRRILKPVKELAQTIKRIKSGEMKARANVRNSGDEVDQLAYEFNTLLDHNEVLVDNLKSTVDNVAHDLRTPLTRLRISVESALMDGKIESYREALQDGLENSEEILKLLNAIMDVSEAETRTMKIHTEKIEVNDFLETLIELYQYVAEDKDIRIHADIPKGLFIKADHVRLGQAFGNLLDNALKFSPTGTMISFKAFNEDGQILITLADEGPGISVEDQDRIWERLYRGDKSRSTPGLGIGLSVVKAVIKAHNGSIRVESSPGHGAKFIVSLPACNA